MYSTEEWKKDNGITDDDVIKIYQAPKENSEEDPDHNPSQNSPLGFDLTGNFIYDFCNLVGSTFQEMFYKKVQSPTGKEFTKVKDEVNAVTQGPVAIIISGNLATQLFTGGFDVSGGVLFILKGEDMGTYALVDTGAPFASTNVSASAAAQIMPVFFTGKPKDFKIENIKGTRLEVNFTIPNSPIVTGGFKSAGNGPKTTFGLYVGVGKSASVKQISLDKPFQTNFGTTYIIGK